jgi:hypothetical protein
MGGKILVDLKMIIVLVMQIFSFPPISDSVSQVLVLGTMPGKMSLRLQALQMGG